ncbi:MAG: hypothetical protein LBR91_00360 [Puniceicoccales bacterium]|nr:hypothetical protein [Puniceicoccales bacterium]
MEDIAARAVDEQLRSQIQQITGEDFEFQGLQATDPNAVDAFNNAMGGQTNFNANGIANDLNVAADSFEMDPQVPQVVVDGVRSNAARIPGSMNTLGRQVLEAVGTGHEGRISDLFSSIKRNLSEVGQVLTKLSNQDNLSQKDLLLIQFQISKMSISLDVASKVGDKGSQALQTLFRDK